MLVEREQVTTSVQFAGEVGWGKHWNEEEWNNNKEPK